MSNPKPGNQAFSGLHAWKRYWCPADEPCPMIEGFLVDPESRYGSLLDQPLCTLEQLATTPCLVLLGESGSGKTQEMAKELERLNSTQDTGENLVLAHDLGAISGGDHLYRKVFDSVNFCEWKSGSRTLYLFLDALDEGLLTMDALARTVLDELQALDGDQRRRLRLRIACRSAVWHQRMTQLHTGLAGLWADQVKVFNLAPLTAADVTLAANAFGQDGAEFLSTIRNKQLTGLATKPITLNLLLDEIRRGESLPEDLAALYEQGCLSLCRERIREMRPSTDMNTAHKRLVIAKRIAATMLLANRSSIWLGINPGDAPQNTVLFSDLVGDKEKARTGSSFEVTEKSVQDAIDNSGLFQSDSSMESGIRWVHRSYPEYLAARYLVERQLPAKRVVQLLTHPTSPGGRLVPQLYSLAGWLGSASDEIAKAILAKQPEVLLCGDPSRLSPALRAQLVEGLLSAFERRELHDRHEWVVRRYDALNHPELAEQLRPYIRDAEHEVATRAACQMAQSLKVLELADDLLALATNAQKPADLRSYAVMALKDINSESHLKELRPLVFGQAGPDPDDSLKGAALLTMWPNHLSAEEVFGVLDEPSNPTFIGLYWHFVSDGMAEDLATSDLEIALNWITQRDPLLGEESILFRAVKGIVQAAWKKLEQDTVADELAAALLTRLRGNRISTLLPKGYEKDPVRMPELTRAVARATARVTDKRWESFDALYLLVRQLPLCWLVEEALEESRPELKELWTDVLRSWLLADWEDHNTFLEITAAADRNTELAHALKPALYVELDSSHARWQQQNLQSKRSAEEKLRQRRRELDQAIKRASKLLDSDQEPSAEMWPRAAWLFQVYPDGRSHTMASPEDLSQRPLWKGATPEHRVRLQKAALAYLVETDPDTPSWLRSNRSPSEVTLGWFAFFLMAETAPHLLDGISAGTWSKWAPILLVWPDLGTREDIRDVLLIRAFTNASRSLIDALIARIEYENGRDENSLFSLRRIDSLLEHPEPLEAIGDALLSLVEAAGLQQRAVTLILRALVRHGFNPAVRVARGGVRAGKPPEFAVSSAAALLVSGRDCGWDVVESFVEAFPALAKKTAFEVVGLLEGWGRGVGQSLGDDDLAAMYHWLTTAFPHESDPGYGQGSGAVTPRMKISDWRDSLLTELKQRGTRTALRQIVQLSEEFPELPWLSWTVRDAAEQVRERGWSRWNPADIRSLIVDQERPIIRNEAELLDALIDALSRYQDRLQHVVTPAAATMWNDSPYRSPKRERALSDEIKRYLEDDLGKWKVSFSREEETRPPGGSVQGQQPDIVARKIGSDANGSSFEIRCAIEVKGSYHKNVKKDMELQLVNRYMKRGGFMGGMYIVVWFDLDGWSDEDARKPTTQRLKSLEHAREFLAEQAKDVLEEGLDLRAVLLDAST